MRAVNRNVGEPAWAAVLALAFGTFALVTSEFLPASLLSPIACDLRISEGVAGQAVTVTALVGAIVAPTIAIITRKFDRRYVVLALSVLLIVSNSVASLSQGLWTLLIARVFLGIALAGFWAMAAALAARLVPATAVAKAMSLIFGGASWHVARSSAQAVCQSRASRGRSNCQRPFRWLYVYPAASGANT